MYDDYRGPGPGSILFAFLLGGAVGAVLGILFAPRSGRETREIIVDKGQEYYDQGKELYAQGMERATEYGTDLKGKYEEASTKVREKVSSTAEGSKESVSKAADATKKGVDKAETKAKEGLDAVAGKAKGAAKDEAADAGPAEA
jgi:gas vesicle protein